LDPEVEGDPASIDADTEPVPIPEDPPEARVHTPPRREEENVSKKVRLECADKECGDPRVFRLGDPQLPGVSPGAAPTGTGSLAQRSKREISLTGVEGADDSKRVRGDFCAITVDEKLDYSTLRDLPGMEHYNKSAFPSDVVAKAKEKGFNLLDEFGVYDTRPISDAEGKKKVDCRSEISLRGLEVKAHIVGREYRWLEERDDVFAPASSSLTSRYIAGHER
jgi:hypothetical protein